MEKQGAEERTIRIGRRQFTAAGVLALLGGAAISISGCGGGGSSSPSGPTAQPSASGDRNGSISANHGHVAVLTAAQIQAGGTVTLGIRGSADHPHAVTFTAAQIQSIASGQRVTQLSTTDDGHAHDVTFN